MSKVVSKIFLLSVSDFTNLVNSSNSLMEILEKIGLKSFSSGNYRTLHKRIKQENLSISHFKRDYTYLKNYQVNKITKKDLQLDSTKSGGSIKKYILRNNLIKYECVKCQNKGNWLGTKLSLQLEHKNGINTDNRLINLEFLCPNCHSQTNSYAGKKNIGL